MLLQRCYLEFIPLSLDFTDKHKDLPFGPTSDLPYAPHGRILISPLLSPSSCIYKVLWYKKLSCDQILDKRVAWKKRGTRGKVVYRGNSTAWLLAVNAWVTRVRQWGEGDAESCPVSPLCPHHHSDTSLPHSPHAWMAHQLESASSSVFVDDSFPWGFYPP